MTNLDKVYKKSYTDKWGYGPFVAADALVINHKAEVLVIRRDENKDEWALPGGFVEPAETPVNAARREMFEETGISPSHIDHKITMTASNPLRDPRAHIVTFLTVFKVKSQLTPAPYINDGEAKEVRWMPVKELLTKKMYADHAELLIVGLSAFDTLSRTPKSKRDWKIPVIQFLTFVAIAEVIRQILFV